MNYNGTIPEMIVLNFVQGDGNSRAEWVANVMLSELTMEGKWKKAYFKSENKTYVTQGII